MASALRVPAHDPAAHEVEQYLLAHERKSLLRFITCGSVDDGKSTLIGRLLYDSRALFEDQLTALESESRRSGSAGGALDFALLVDGLAAESEQGITIDVAYRFFATDKRKFIAADTPGHERYTRNMVTGASTADLAVILVDVRKGVLTQTRRHSHIVHLLGIRQIVLAVNKMDLVDYGESRFNAIVEDYARFAASAGIDRFTAIPLSGLTGDNVTRPSDNMGWHEGPSLLEHLERATPATALQAKGFRMPVQWVNRFGQDFRGYAGTVASGEICAGMPVRLEPSGQRSSIARILTHEGDVRRAAAGQAVTVTLADEVDCSRGEMILDEAAQIAVRDHLDATLVWMASEPMVPGRAYWLKIGTRTIAASISRVREVVDVDSMEPGVGRPLALNDIGRCNILLDRPVAALPYAQSRELGGFILIDRASHATVAAGMIDDFPREAPDNGYSESAVGRVVWLVGSSQAERIEVARRAQERLVARGRPALILDPHAVRAGISRDLGETESDEIENRRRVSEVAKLVSRAGVTVLVAMEVPAGEQRHGMDVDITRVESGWDWQI